MITRLTVFFLMLIVLLGGVAAPVSAQSPAEARLAHVDQWFYYISVDLASDELEQIRTSTYDLVVIDPIVTEENNEDYDIAGTVAALQQSGNGAGQPKLVLAYIDIGQAESYRTYWQSGWRIGDPVWIAGGDPDGWEENYPVAYWYDEWYAIWFDGFARADGTASPGLLQVILDAGFDGIYLDWVEAYDDPNVIELAEAEGLDATEEMIWFIEDISAFVKAQDPDHIVIAQNAAQLAEYDDYLAVIDGIAQEQTWFDGGADGQPEGDCPLPATEADVDTAAYADSLSPICRAQYEEFPDSTLHVSSEEYLYYLTLARDKGEFILTVDYALDPANVAWIYAQSRALGFVPFAGARSLDRFIPPQP